MAAVSQSDLSVVLLQLEEAAPRLYSRWNEKAWRLICRGPAAKLWDALADTPDGRAAMEDYLFLAREAIGMQYLAATRPEDLEPGAPAHGFLAVILCETLPRLLPKSAGADRARALAQAWNVGEGLVGKPVWIDRYLAARLPELDDLGKFESFLERVVEEGFDEQSPSTWQKHGAVVVLDPTRFDHGFLPGDMHLATPSVVCVHDRRDDARHLAVMLRRGKSVGLGMTPCLGREKRAEPRVPEKFLSAAFAATGLAEMMNVLFSLSGFAIYTTSLSQRMWVVESEP